MATESVSVAQIEQWLNEVYGHDETEEKAARRGRVLKDGEAVSFQVLGLRRAAEQAILERREAEIKLAQGTGGILPALSAPLPPGAEDDVPDPIEGYENPLPNFVPQVKSIGILGAVQRWGKPQNRIKVGSKTEGIHVRCPFPTHNDNNPSAWINTNNDTWFCGACQVGGDVLDYYAARQGIDHAGLQENFKSILDEMKADLGLDIETPPLTDVDDEPDEPDDPPIAATPPPPDPTPPAPEVAVATPDPEAPEPPTPEPPALTIDDVEIDPTVWDPRDEDDDILARPDTDPRFDWRSLPIPEGTFLHRWCEVNEEELPWIPPEYFMMLGFQAIGMAAGHYKTTFTYGGRLTAALMLTLVGPSGYGKSMATRRLLTMFNHAECPKFDSDMGTGIKVLASIVSGEALVQDMKTMGKLDPSDPDEDRVEVPTTGWWFEDEFATFVAKARRPSSTMKTRVMQFFDFSKMNDMTMPETVVRESTVTNGMREVHDSFFTATFLTQPDAIRRLADENDLVTGFFNRILPVFGRPIGKRDAFTVPTNMPDYFEYYDNLWKWCRIDFRDVVFSDAAKHRVNDDPWYEQSIAEGNKQSILARLYLMAMKIALCLAINEQSDEITVRHLDAGKYLAQHYFKPCYASLVADVHATKVTDIRDQMVEFVKDYFAKHDQWPTRSQLAQKSFWRNADLPTQQMAMESLSSNHEVVEVYMINGARTSTILIAVDLPGWKRLAEFHHKKVEKAAIYA